ncbi:beta-N-acetylhexosaminidase [Rhodoplanes elegans]|uniref:beta-N-acetylhexosaminidase n=1 Tax=Rhodoplanes elegans TaxID=29408 RepID=A0A327JPR3_9BRAD|nr:beta-N-acetylhexosaminidase [Rhodoplanes elegans]MBK5962023.1 beta-N-acetylhexosaminidase [Rhodoplanes elegans]RAI28450.1 beta-N-acetylhexosaminidase [Rhodoplanes elegans]
MTARAFITGVSGLRLTDAERQFLRTVRPFGLILFKRNVDTPAQVAALVDEFRDAVGVEAAVLVDQEGGRVQRLGPPHWPAYPAGAWYGALHARDPAAGLAAARLGARLIAADLFALGITVDCLPVGDVPAPEGDPVIGDRAYGTSPGVVAALAAAAAEGLMAGGVLPVVKHMPGHGRAACDSHKALPVVAADRATLAATDVAAFRPLAGLPFGMTAHVVYTALDRDHPATLSPTVIGEVIRGAIGFSGALMTDDLSMGALSGSLAARTRAALAAGCDLALHCNGNLVEMEQVAAEAPTLSGASAERCAAALAARRPPDGIDLAEARAAFSRMIAAS